MNVALVLPAFIAGVFTFLAPCTLPLVPAYLSFISGVSQKELAASGARRVRLRVFANGLAYVVGFSAVFITLGVLFGFGGATLIQYRLWLSRIGGIFVILFGLFLLGAGRITFLNVFAMERRLAVLRFLKPGNPLSSFIFGATFAFGWTPCVGPILGSILTLAAASATVAQGAFLLVVFSLGLAAPFLAIALVIGFASRSILFLLPHFQNTCPQSLSPAESSSFSSAFCFSQTRSRHGFRSSTACLAPPGTTACSIICNSLIIFVRGARR